MNALSTASVPEPVLGILRERYLRCDESGRPLEDVDGMFRRVASAIAEPARRFGEDTTRWEDRFHERLARLEFLPNSPTLMNAGVAGGQLAACFVLPIEDDLDSIFAALHRMARIQQSGAGTGFSFSRLRPRGDRVASTGGVTSGPLSFIELFDRTTRVIRLGGRRRGANMAVLRIDHPDIEEFVAAKRESGALESFNLSVGITDEFLAALDVRREFPLRNPRTGALARTIDPAVLYDSIVDSAWVSGEPGLLFLDEVHRHNPTPALGTIEATNPCGEQPLLPHESCVLGSVNLAAFARDDSVDWPRLREAIRDGVVFLDNVIEANVYPAPEIEAATRRTRKIGLGVMGFAELLARVGVAYDSDAGRALGASLACVLTSEARATSIELAGRRGSFPAFAASVWPDRGLARLRNAAVTCVAPTGTISWIARTSSGIEPFFALATARRCPGAGRVVEVNPLVAAALAALGPRGDDALREIEQHGSVRRLETLPAALRRRLPVALEIAPADHVRMQAAFQEHVDAAVSKTVNLPASATREAVAEVFRLARRYRLKGITVYRYGSREGQPLALADADPSGECRECAT